MAIRVPGAVAFAGDGAVALLVAVAITVVPTGVVTGVVPAMVVPADGTAETVPVELFPVAPAVGAVIAAITAIAGTDPATVGTGKGVAVATASVGGGIGDGLGTGVTGDNRLVRTCRQ